MSSPAIQFRSVSKSFPGVNALSEVSFEVRRGSCHAVCGENGAGKSTLGKVLAGLYEADGGEILLDGKSVSFASPRDALASGVAMVHQELAFCENLTVADNLCLGELPHRLGFVNRQALRERAQALLADIGASIRPDRSMESLGVAEQQLVQIAAAVGSGARVIVFDEPTSSLGDREATRLYDLIDALKARGVTMLFVSHRMPEIFRLCDDITVLRDGRHVATRPASELPERELVQMMIGRAVDQYFPARVASSTREELLRVEGLGSSGHFGNVTFALHRGEVVGLAGLMGAGRSEIACALFGLDRSAVGRISVRGRDVRIRSASDAMALGIGFVPEDRKKQGLVLSMATSANTTLPTLRRVSRVGWVDRNAEHEVCARYFARLNVRAGEQSLTAALSGGNQQKIVLAKWLAAKCDVLILDEPTRGVDVGAKAEIHALIDGLASEGAAVLLISSELPELINLCNRIMVLRAGRLVGELPRETASQDALLRLMTGLEEARAQEHGAATPN